MDLHTESKLTLLLKNEFRQLERGSGIFFTVLFTSNDNKLSGLLIPGEIHTFLVQRHTWMLDFITRD